MSGFKWCPYGQVIINFAINLSSHGFIHCQSSPEWLHCSAAKSCVQFSSVQSLSHVRLFATPWIAAPQASLSITSSGSSPKLMSIELVIPSNHLILCPSPSPAFNLSQHQGLFQWVSSSDQVAKGLMLQLQHQSFQWIFRTISFRIDWFELAVQGTLKSLLQHHSSNHQFFSTQLSLWSNFHIHTLLLEKP